MKNIPIGEVLKEYGYINEEQLNIALEAQKKDRSKRLGEHLVSLGFITEEQTLQALSDKLAQPIIPLGSIDVNLVAVEKIPETVSKKYNIFAYGIDEVGYLMVVTNDPLNFYGIEDVRLVTGLNIKVALATKAEVMNAIQYYYQELETRHVASQINESMHARAEDIIDLFDSNEDDTPVVKMFNSLVVSGYTNNASDIHIEPFDEEILVRMRVDGMIVNFLQLNKSLHDSLIVRIKIMSNLDIAEKRVPQDGHFVGVIDGIEINARVSIIPTIFGEKVVLRFLNSNAKISGSNTFGMTKQNYEKMRKMINMPHGIIYVTGPTGSGKTTTLYMILEELAMRQVNISTIEDPVERRISKVNQMQVNNLSGLTFERGLRALLRQDPDVIMVGETRDAETAAISVRASITGHLVFSTLHTNDAVSAIVRLEDMGVEPYMVANSLVGVVAQRLVRTICPQCKQEVPISDLDRQILGDEVEHLYKGHGCPNCNNTGYKGRVAVHEIILIDGPVRKMISNHAEMDDIYAYIKEHQDMSSLRDGVLELVKEGNTTLEELQKVVVYLD